MPIVTQTLRFRERRHAKENQSPWGKLGLIIGIIVSLVMVIFTLVGIRIYFNIIEELPPVDTFSTLLESANGAFHQPTRLYDRTHEHVILSLENPSATNRKYINLHNSAGNQANQALQYLAEATLAVHDPGFWKEPGYSLIGIIEGTHPTLAQQLISDLILDRQPASLARNIRERFLAAQITSQFGRDKVLEWYLNNAQYGTFIYGVDAAARVYFGKSAYDLSLAESTMLVAIEQSPAIDPWHDPSSIKEQQVRVIQGMLDQGYIFYDQAQQALKENIQFQPQESPQSLYPEFTNLVLQQISTAMPLERIYRGGYEIITTLDYGLQDQATCAAQTYLAGLTNENEQIFTSDGSPCDATQVLLPSPANQEFDSQDLNAEIVILDPRSGQILTMVGNVGRDVTPGYPNPHQIGTIIAPFMYLTGLSRGMSPATMLWDIPTSEVTDGFDFSNPNDMLATYHGPVRLRVALANDYTGAASEVFQRVGAQNVGLTEKQFGIDTTLSTTSTETIEDLYSQQDSLLEITRAYGVLADEGRMNGQPDMGGASGMGEGSLIATTIIRMTDMQDHTLLDWSKPQSLSVVSTQLAYLTTDVLHDEAARKTNLGQHNSLELDRPVAVKSGMSIDKTIGWSVGYTPQLVAGVWIGHSQVNVNDITPEIPYILWYSVMQFASQSLPVQDFLQPEGISRVLVCDPSGMLVSPVCPSVVEEVFLSGNEPTQIDNLYQEYYINRETGRLATIFTPANLVEEKVYMIIPPSAIDWAKEVGLPIAPDAYDDSYPPTQYSSYAQFDLPQMYDHVSGIVRLLGSAGGEGFSYYRLQVGQGYYPRLWTQIGENFEHPVMGGLLGTWDTSGLQGIYVIELMVVKQDKQIEQAFLQVTVDNEAPQVKILTPEDGEILNIAQDRALTIQASVSDDLGIMYVDFYIDDVLDRTLYQPPWIFFGDTMNGKHKLTIIAYDLAGNESEATVSFEIEGK